MDERENRPERPHLLRPSFDCDEGLFSRASELDKRPMHARAAHHQSVSLLEDVDGLLGGAIGHLSDKTPQLLEAFSMEGSAARAGAGWAGGPRTGISLQGQSTTTRRFAEPKQLSQRARIAAT